MNRLIIACSSLLLTLTAFTVPSYASDTNDVSITISPLHLAFPFVEVSGEYRLSDSMGVGAIVGFGGINPSRFSNSSIDEDFTIAALAATFRYYAIGDFDHGMTVAAELYYLGIFGDSDRFESTGFLGSGLSISPMIGYKLITGIGFTFEAQLGPAFVVALANGESGSDVVGANLNLNIGWSF